MYRKNLKSNYCVNNIKCKSTNHKNVNIQKASGLKLAGQGTPYEFEGGAMPVDIIQSLINLGSTHVGSALSSLPAHGVLGASVLAAVGGYLLHKKKKKGKGLVGSGRSHFEKQLLKHLRANLKKVPHHIGVAKSKIKKQHIIDFIKKHQGKKIHISDIYGNYWKEKGKLLSNVITKAQQGGSILGSIKKGLSSVGKFTKKAAHSTYKKLHDFAQGKTKFKPSQLANYLASGVGAIGTASALIPGVDLISVPTAGAVALGLKSASLALKTSGRGYEGTNCSQEGGRDGPLLSPAEIEAIHSLATEPGSLSFSKISLLLGVTGLALTSAYKLYKKLKKEFGKKKGGQYASGLNIAGGDYSQISQIPASIRRYLESHPTISKNIARESLDNKQIGSGKASNFLMSLGLAGTSASAGAYGFYKYLLNNPSFATKIAMKGTSSAISNYLGSGISLAGQGENSKQLPFGVKTTATGKIKKDRYSVWYGYHNKTSGGLSKSDFFLRGKKVISKKKSAMGKKLKAQNRGIFKK